MNPLDRFPFLAEQLPAADARRVVLARGLAAYPLLRERATDGARRTAWLPDLIEAQPVDALVRNTPYFSHHLRRLYGLVAAQAPTGEIDAALDRVALAALDALAGSAGGWPEGRFDVPRLAGVQMLRLGAFFGSAPATASRTPLGLAFGFDAGDTLQLDAPSTLLGVGAGAPALRLIQDCHVAMGDSRNHLELDAARIAALAPQLRAGFDFIDRVCPCIAAMVHDEIRYVAPLVKGERAHYSFTLSDFPGLLFIGAADEPLSIVEAIVHETAHARLHHANEALPIATNDPNVGLYSPWRNDPRPATGLLHALYVFSLVLGFWLVALERAGATWSARESAYVRARIALICLQLHEAMSVLDQVELGPLGRIVLAAAHEITPRPDALPLSVPELDTAREKARAKRERARAEHARLVMPA